MATKRGGKFWARVRLNGHNLSKAFPTQREAEAWEHDTRQAILAGKPIVGNIPTVGNFFVEACNYIWSDSPNYNNQIAQATALADFIGNDKLVSVVSNADAISFRTAKMKEGRAGSTLNNYAATFNRIMKHAKSCGFVDSDVPTMDYSKQRKGKVRFLTVEEEAAIISYFEFINRHDYVDLVICLINTGARVSELLKLDWADVKIDTVTFWDTKSGHPRTVPLTKASRTALDRRRASGGTGPFKIPYQTFRDAMDRAKEACGITDITIHTLRHTCASRLVQGGVDIRRVKDWMGHSTIQTTMIYAHLAPADLFVGASVLDQFNTGDNVVKIGTNRGTN